jgi:hypothetical protein
MGEVGQTRVGERVEVVITHSRVSGVSTLTLSSTMRQVQVL